MPSTTESNSVFPFATTLKKVSKPGLVSGFTPEPCQPVRIRSKER